MKAYLEISSSPNQVHQEVETHNGSFLRRARKTIEYVGYIAQHVSKKIEKTRKLYKKNSAVRITFWVCTVCPVMNDVGYNLSSVWLCPRGCRMS